MTSTKQGPMCSKCYVYSEERWMVYNTFWFCPSCKLEISCSGKPIETDDKTKDIDISDDDDLSDFLKMTTFFSD